MLQVENIIQSFNKGTVNETQVFNGFNLTVNDGEFVTVIGSNGSGKTTLLNIICGSIPLDSGSVSINGDDITNLPEHLRYKNIGRVFQDPAVGTSPSMTLLQNLSLADNKNKPFDLTSGTNKARIKDYQTMLAKLDLGLEDKLHVKVGALSGGQRQAISLLMSTLTPVDFLILDEHTAALDPKTAHVIMELTDQIVREKGLTSIMVTHNLRYAIEYGTRLIMMHEGEIILDLKDQAKKDAHVDDLLTLFNKISLERGNSL